jgi:hypothetical protein
MWRADVLLGTDAHHVSQPAMLNAWLKRGTGLGIRKFVVRASLSNCLLQTRSVRRFEGWELDNPSYPIKPPPPLLAEVEDE